MSSPPFLWYHTSYARPLFRSRNTITHRTKMNKTSDRSWNISSKYQNTSCICTENTTLFWWILIYSTIRCCDSSYILFISTEKVILFLIVQCSLLCMMCNDLWTIFLHLNFDFSLQLFSCSFSTQNTSKPSCSHNIKHYF